jgi:predicted DNA-binding transcriptional regulator YafY
MISVSFTQEDLNALAALLDTAVKATGIQGARAALPLIDKLEKAVADANKPKPEQETE